MNYAISNIAWEKHDDPTILKLLQKYGISGIEVAPTKIWPNWLNANVHNAKLYRESMLEHGFEIPAMQAIVFGKPELQLLQPESHPDFIKHINHIAGIASELGAKVLVFGAPKNRKRGQLSISQANDIAIAFFRKVAVICNNMGCCIGLEHNPVEYQCDYITNVSDARELVDMVDHPGFQLHLDSAGIHMCGGNIAERIATAGHFVHYHISEPMLNPIYKGEVDHVSAHKALVDCNYDQWVSIEMKQPDSIKSLEYSLATLSDYRNA